MVSKPVGLGFYTKLQRNQLTKKWKESEPSSKKTRKYSAPFEAGIYTATAYFNEGSNHLTGSKQDFGLRQSKDILYWKDTRFSVRDTQYPSKVAIFSFQAQLMDCVVTLCA